MEIRNQSEQTEAVKRYTGKLDVNVIAFNPTKAELEKLGYTPKDEPKYFGPTKDNTGTYGRLAFYVQATVNGDTIKSIVSFMFGDKPRTNKDGTKYQWIDKLGRTTWSPTVGEIKSEYFDVDSAQHCYGIGHEEFIRFIRAWGNIDSKNDSQLKHPSDIANGKFAEVKKWFDMIHKVGNSVGVLLAANGAYINVYTGYFSRGGSQTLTYWKSHLSKALKNAKSAGFSWKYDFQGDLKLQEYKGDSDTSMSDFASGPEDDASPSSKTVKFEDDADLF
jgi:hypothetical protein